VKCTEKAPSKVRFGEALLSAMCSGLLYSVVISDKLSVFIEFYVDTVRELNVVARTLFFDTYNLFAQHVGFNIFCNQRGNESRWNRCIVADLDILPVAVAVK